MISAYEFWRDGNIQTKAPTYHLTLSDLLEVFLLSVPSTLGFAGLELLVHKEASSFHRDHIKLHTMAALWAYKELGSLYVYRE